MLKNSNVQTTVVRVKIKMSVYPNTTNLDFDPHSNKERLKYKELFTRYFIIIIYWFVFLTSDIRRHKKQRLKLSLQLLWKITNEYFERLLKDKVNRKTLFSFSSQLLHLSYISTSRRFNRIGSCYIVFVLVYPQWDALIHLCYTRSVLRSSD